MKKKGGIQQNLDVYDLTDEDGHLKTIPPGDVLKLLRALKKRCKSTTNATIIFHNDIDGLGAAIFAKELLKNYGCNISVHDLVPARHVELEGIKHDPTRIYFYVDIQPYPFYQSTASRDLKEIINDFDKGVFCVDHHLIAGNPYKFTDHTFVFCPTIVDWAFPTTAALLMRYFLYIQKRGKLDYQRYVNERVWASDKFTRWLILLCAVGDHLWLLGKDSKNSILKELLNEYGHSEVNLIKMSMVASLSLGIDRSGIDRKRTEHKQTEELLTLIPGEIDLESPTKDMTSHIFDEIYARYSAQVDNLYNFAEGLDRAVRELTEERNHELADQIKATKSEILRTKSRIEDYNKAMPRVLQKDRESLLHLAETIGDRNDPKWQQIEFYGTELERLQTKLGTLDNQLSFLEEKQEMVLPGNIPGLCVFISKQSSEQVKGILSSLLYYFGHNNIVIEEDEHIAFWGSRGLSRDRLEQELTTLRFDRRSLESYRSTEEAIQVLPKNYIKSLNISKNISFEGGYVGGIGGRGKVFGGNIKGEVPQLFAILERSSLQSKIKELIEHGELNKALKGLTEGESKVTTAQALRTKFKTREWVTIQVVGGANSGDILSGDVGLVLAWLAGYSKKLT